ncbi:DODA-type extradiol aromatic ring-opening family dioxygenase [Uliginosibacterium gangwonense]|uniref:DODA-type extradiol aromatic ring-opening family dioxygenase n=1 Tax=Uliginosibacterium gangwonense TaxID=392736 RepID=UPI0003A9B0A0|nr:class III extradiol ring-cleavage dioxygenase [Uliginosibacterium gangwonense]
MTTRMPVLFISHGSPMHAIEPSTAATAWAEFAAGIPVPRAVLMVSAHWESGIPLLGGNPQPETIHDFGGFPEELYRIHYAAPGAPDVAQEALQLLRDAGFSAGIEGCRGLDHGAWIPMLKMYPRANIPVLQLSVQPALGAPHHLALGRALMALRDTGVFIIGSGHMTHNLRDFFVNPVSSGAVPYVKEFRDWVDQRVRSGNTEELLQWEHLAPHARRAHPTSEHFLPLFVALGAAGEGYKVESSFEYFDGGVLAMDAYKFV